MEQKLVLTVGLPRSGKSTWAKSTGYPIVNRDSIRLALHGQAYIQESEEMVSAIEMYMVKSLFLAGHIRVIIDSTNLKEKYHKRWEYGNWIIILEVFNTSKEECIKRAIKDKREDLIPIIERMAADVENNSN
jgi:predicted kinase